MYLSVLSNEEKALFLGLAYNLATVDGDYSEAEQMIINGYCQEMQMKFDEKTMVKSIDDILVSLNEKSIDKVKKIVVFEAIGLAMADNHYDSSERKIVRQMETVFGLEDRFSKRCEEILDEYIAFQNKINKFILE